MIHFHGTPLGGQRDQVTKFFTGRYGFVSWLRPEDLPTIADVGRGFAIDNGAFTAWKQGQEIKWQEYLDFCKLWCRHPRFHFAVIPDTIDGTEKDNRDLVAWWDKKAYHPMRVNAAPVWHLHESLDWLKYLVDHYRLICLGSSGEWSNPGEGSWFHRMNEAMQVICDEEGRPKTRIHGMRMLSREIVPYFPFWSADSTNVAQNANSMGRFGTYTPATRAQRAEAIASTIESVQSPAVYRPYEHVQNELFRLFQEEDDATADSEAVEGVKDY
jgi:hypothetical protein